MRPLFVLLIITGCAHSLSAQKADTLRQVSKTAQRSPMRLSGILRNGPVLDSATLAYYSNQNLAALLAQQSYSFVRQYGTNGPATLLLRGASAAQTAVRWNGVPIQNSATGITDLSLIPTAAINNVYLSPGSAGSYEGSGAVGGVLYLTSTQPAFDGRCNAAATLAGGSFGNVMVSTKAALSGKKWAGSAGVQYQQADNNFEYTDLLGRTVRLDNAHLAGINVQANIARKLSAKDVISLSLWGSRYLREIPPALFESQSVKMLRDVSLKSVLSWQHTSNSAAYGAKASVVGDWFEYRDPAAALAPDYQTRQLYGNLWARKYLPHHIVAEGGIPVQYNYFVGGDGRKIARAALVAGFTKHFFRGLYDSTDGGVSQASKATVALNGRAESVEGKSVLLGDFLAVYSVAKSLAVRASVGNTYRYPTLNELYYFPGGNKNLKPETGWSTEAGYDWKPTVGGASVSFTHRGTAYYRNVNDWIIWYGGAIWTPHNIAEVVSKGIETENRLTWRRPRIRSYISAGGSAVSSVTVKSDLPGDGSIGHQIPYAPRFTAQGNAGFNTARWRFNYNHTYTADRYFNSDETGLLPAFTTGNLMAGWLYRRKNWSADLALTIQNIWDARYAEVSGRPAMGRNFLLSCTVAGFK